MQTSGLRTILGKYEPKMIRLCVWPFETKVVIFCDSFFRKPCTFSCLLSFIVITIHSQSLIVETGGDPQFCATNIRACILIVIHHMSPIRM